MRPAATNFTNLARRRSGLTLIELLIVVTIVALLFGLLLPAIQSMRESGRRVSCENNLRQIGIALQNHSDIRAALPVGAKSRVTFGQSWWVSLLPYLEHKVLYDELDVTGPNNGSVTFSLQNGKAINGIAIDVMACPSSGIPLMWPTGAIQIMMPSYVGISGAANDVDFPETRVNSCCVSDGNLGQISAGGVLLVNRAVKLKQITDGLSRTMVLGECSDYAVDNNGSLKRIDGGLPVGWLTGTTARGVPPDYSSTFAPPSYNLTTIRYSPNMRSYDRPGISEDHGANNPLISPHPGGVYSLLLDGAVRFLEDGMDIVVLKMLGTRDDGEVSNSAGGLQ